MVAFISGIPVGCGVPRSVGDLPSQAPATDGHDEEAWTNAATAITSSTETVIPVDSASNGFVEFYAAGFTRVTTQMYAYTADLCLSQDLAQEAFCRAFAKWSKLSTYDDPLAWVRRVAFNLAKSRWQRTKTSIRYLRSQREHHVDGPDPTRVALATALAQLPARQRRAMVLHYLADMSVADIAEQEGVAVGTVKSWLHRGRTALAGLIGEGEGSHV